MVRSPARGPADGSDHPQALLGNASLGGRHWFSPEAPSKPPGSGGSGAGRCVWPSRPQTVGASSATGQHCGELTVGGDRDPDSPVLAGCSSPSWAGSTRTPTCASATARGRHCRRHRQPGAARAEGSGSGQHGGGAARGSGAGSSGQRVPPPMVPAATGNSRHTGEDWAGLGRISHGTVQGTLVAQSWH